MNWRFMSKLMMYIILQIILVSSDREASYRWRASATCFRRFAVEINLNEHYGTWQLTWSPNKPLKAKKFVENS
jgi:hypothetical protein